MFSQTYNPVVSYDDDVHVWVYFDNQEGLLRFEAYLIGYDDNGGQSTLELVLEEGVIGTVQEIDFLMALFHDSEMRRKRYQTPFFTVDGRCFISTEYNLYPYLTKEQIGLLHSYFEKIESHLKEIMRVHWMQILKSLGYDVIKKL